MRRGGRLRERLTARDLAGRLKLSVTFAIHRDSLSLVVMFCNCQIVSKLPVRHLCVVNHVCTSNAQNHHFHTLWKEYEFRSPIIITLIEEDILRNSDKGCNSVQGLYLKHPGEACKHQKLCLINDSLRSK